MKRGSMMKRRKYKRGYLLGRREYDKEGEHAEEEEFCGRGEN